MRIMFVSLTPFPRTGGQTTFLLQMSDEMRGKGHEVRIITPSQFPVLWMTLTDKFSALLRVVFGSWLWFFFRMRAIMVLLRLYMVKEGLLRKTDVIDAGFAT